MNHSDLLEWAEGIQASPLGVWLSESPLAFPIIEGLHLISMGLALGLLFLIDLRLLGLIWREVPIRPVLTQLRPYVLGGFAVVFASGLLLFWAEAPTLVASPAFPFKLAFLVLAGLNALYFEQRIAPALPADSQSLSAHVAARYAGLASLLLWTLVVVAGRLIPYLPQWS